MRFNLNAPPPPKFRSGKTSGEFVAVANEYGRKEVLRAVSCRYIKDESPTWIYELENGEWWAEGSLYRATKIVG